MHPNRKTHTDKSRVFDKYYTKKAAVRRCLDAVKNLPRSYDCVIDPAAGAGAFYDEIDRRLQHRGARIGLDIAPGNDGIIKQDWLDYEISAEYESVLVVGNPPFGRYNELSTLFIKHALSFPNVQTIAFVLPNVFKKHTRQKCLPAHWRILSITELGKNSFTLDGKDYHLPAGFFVFDKSAGKDLRTNPALYKETGDFAFGDKNDFDVFVFGAAPKKVITNPQPNNRGYYLKSKIPVEALRRKIKSVDWTGNSCANGGVYWLTKHEFLEQYIRRYSG